MAAGGVVVVVILAAGGWWTLSHRTSPPVVAVAASRPAAYSPQDRRQSIIILPFENSSGDPAQDGVAAGITRDVTDSLSQDSTTPVVPALTAAAYRGKALDLRAIGRDHNVHFALTGNARREDGRLIVAATLYDIADDRPIWSKKYDRPDRPDEWSFIVRGISVVERPMLDAEASRAMREHPDGLDKRDLMFVASATSLSAATKENRLAQIALVERALAIDPNYVWALRDNARLHADLVLLGFSSDPDGDLGYAMRLLDRALQIAPNDVDTLSQKSVVLRAQGNLDEAAALLRKVLEIRPLWGFRYNDLGSILLIQGRRKEALDNYMKAKHLAVGTDAVNFIDSNLAFALLANDRYPEAIAQARLAIPQFPPETGRNAEIPWLALIAAESANGQDAEAHADLQKSLSTPRNWRTMAEVQKRPYFAAIPQLLEGLRRAGMPAE
jgi:TolB-like protein